MGLNLSAEHLPPYQVLVGCKYVWSAASRGLQSTKKIKRVPNKAKSDELRDKITLYFSCACCKWLNNLIETPWLDLWIYTAEIVRYMGDKDTIGDLVLLNFQWLLQWTLEMVPTFSILGRDLSSVYGYVCLLTSNDDEPVNVIHLKMVSPGVLDCIVQFLL